MSNKTAVFPQLSTCGAQKGLRSLPSDKFEKSQSLDSLLPFQNRRVIPVERNITGRGLHVKNRPQGCIFFSLTKPKISNVCKFQMEGSLLSVPLPLLRFWTSPKDIHKVDENSHFSVEKTVCTSHYFAGRYSANGFIKGGADTCKGHSDISSSEFRFSDKPLKISTLTMSKCTIFGYGNQLSRNDTLPQEKKGKIVQQCQDLPGKLSASIRERSYLIGRLVSTAVAVLPAPLQYRAM